MGNKDKDKNQGDSAASEGLQETSLAPGLPTTPTETSAGKEKPRTPPWPSK